MTGVRSLMRSLFVEYEPGRPCCRFCGVPVDPTRGCQVATCHGGMA